MSISEVLDLKAALLAGIRDDETVDETLDSETIHEDVDLLLMEVNSGASFEQYFLWTSVERISRIVDVLQRVGLPEVATLTDQAVEVGFPDGLPHSDDEKERQVAMFDGDQTSRLVELARQFTVHNAKIESALAALGKDTGT